MWRNYFVTSIRNLFQYRIYSLITILGLSLGLMICLGIALFLNNELNYDRFHNDADRIYRVNSHINFPDNKYLSPVTSYRLFQYVTENFPQIESGCLTKPFSNGAIINLQSERIVEKGRILFADNNFLSVFDFPLKNGSIETALKDPFAVLLTPEKAAAYFGDTAPLGQTLSISILDTTLLFTVTGLIEKPQENSSIKFDLIISYSTLEVLPVFEDIDIWTNVMESAYIKLVPNTDPTETVEQFNKAITEIFGDKLFFAPFLQPLTDIHLNTAGLELYSAGDLDTIYLYSGLAILVLLIAVVNYINLATARAATREREIGMRKVLGDRKRSLLVKFLIESIIYVFIAGILSILFTDIFLSFFNDIVGVDLSVSVLADPVYISVFILILLLTGIAAGIYPALYLTGFRAIRLLRREQSKGSSGRNFRRTLVIAQFSSAVILISGSAYIFEQVSMMEERKLGFNQEQLIQLPLFDKETAEKSFRLKERLKHIAGVSSVSVSQRIHHVGAPSKAVWFENETEEDLRNVNVKAIDGDAINTLQFTMVEGSWFSKEYGDGNLYEFVVNETFVDKYKLEQPIGSIIYMSGREGKIIGVVKDFHFQPFHYSIQPIMLYPVPVEDSPWWHYFVDYIYIRLNEQHSETTLAEIERNWAELFPDKPFIIEYLSETISSFYADERQIGEMVLLFAIFGIAVALLGLYGLTLFTMERKRKEIGIRKVLGAGTNRIIFTLSRQFMLLITVSVAAAFPITYILIDKWLDTFAYHISFSPLIFLLAALTVTSFSILTVGVLAKRASEANPVDTIRHE